MVYSRDCTVRKLIQGAVSTGEKLRCVVHKSPDSFHLDSTIRFCTVAAAANGINDGYTINFQGRARATLEIRIRKQRLLG